LSTFDQPSLPPIALQVIATNLPPEEIEGIRRMFGEMDDDGSGTISFEELREGGGAAGRVFVQSWVFVVTGSAA
jgi:calcium-dependent protein kinase